MQLTIYGVGTALPPNQMTQNEATELAMQAGIAGGDQARLVKVLYRRSGVQTRYTAVPHQVAYDFYNAAIEEADTTEAVKISTLGPTTQQRMAFYRDCAPPLALLAAREALERGEIAPRAITHLVTVSCTGFMAPGIDVELINGLSLAPTVERVHVGFMGCHGALNGLRVARGLAAADPRARVLLCAVELCALHYRFEGETDQFVSNSIFSDGAAAIVGGGEPCEGEWRVADTGSCLIPDSTDAMSWNIGDHGFEMTLSPRVPDLICQHLRPWLTTWLKRNGLTLDDIGSWAVHPGGPRILRAVEESLNLPESALEVSYEVLSECGNMSSPTVLFILDRLRKRDASRPCVALGFGPGLMAEAALLL